MIVKQPNIIRRIWWNFWYDWMASADYDSETGLYLAEDQDGVLFMPSALAAEVWGPKRFDPRNPLHWPTWFRSRWSNKIVMVETS